MVMQKQFISANEFIEISEHPEYDDRTVELVEGLIVEMSKPGWNHGEILMLLASRIYDHVRAHDLGRVSVGDTGFLLEQREDGKDTVRGLDFAFISKERAQRQDLSGLTTIAPDLAVEVLSPSNEAVDIRLKIQQLLDAGSSMVWVVYPEMRIVDVHTRSGATSLTENDSLQGGSVLPGFQMRVADIFPADNLDA